MLCLVYLTGTTCIGLLNIEYCYDALQTDIVSCECTIV